MAPPFYVTIFQKKYTKMSLFESIYVGFWMHFASHIAKTTPPARVKSLNYATLGLNAAFTRLILEPEENKENVIKCASEVLGYIVQINLIKKHSFDLRYVLGRRAK